MTFVGWPYARAAPRSVPLTPTESAAESLPLVREQPKAGCRLCVGGMPASAHVLDWCWCCPPQAVDLHAHATHEQQVDIMLGAITKARCERVAACPGWETTGAGRLLAKYGKAWTAFRSAKLVEQDGRLFVRCVYMGGRRPVRSCIVARREVGGPGGSFGYVRDVIADTCVDGGRCDRAL